MKSIALVTLIAAAAHGQQSQNRTIPVRSLAPASAATTTPLRTILGNVRQLPGGKLLVNDAIGHRLVLFESSLTSFTVLRDSLPGLPNSYGPRSGILINYLGDSSLFVDVGSQSLSVVDPAGAFVRTIAAPNPRDLSFLSRLGAGVDAKGRLIYQGTQPTPPQPARSDQVRISQPPDSAPILRADFETRTVDTIGRIKINGGNRRESSGTQNKMFVNPITNVDEWTLLPDGTVAFVRGFDYHVDWINPDGARRSSPKMPFDWRRLTDQDKQHLIDSIKTDQITRDSTMAARGGRPPAIRIENGRDIAITEGGSTTQVIFVPLDQMVDYFPPIRNGAVRVDLEGNLWILPTTTLQSASGELVYDVVNRTGEIFERVRMPKGRGLAGFGKSGVVYLSWQEQDKGWFIEQTRVVR